MRVLFAVRGQRLLEQWAQAQSVLSLAEHELIFLHIINSAPDDEVGAAESPTPTLPRTLPTRRREGQQGSAAAQRGQALLDMALTLAGSEGIHARTILAEGEVADAILQEAEALEAELIILGRRYQDQAQQALLGRVTGAVAQRASCPVLILP